MRRIFFLVPFFLIGCLKVDTSDLNDFVADVIKKEYPISDKVPILKKVESIEFTQFEARDPFSLPVSGKTEPVKKINNKCQDISSVREKDILESYPLDNLKMLGSMEVDNKLWALIGVSEGQLHKVKKGDYLGLNAGLVKKITAGRVEIIETVQDKDGCLEKRSASLSVMAP